MMYILLKQFEQIAVAARVKYMEIARHFGNARTRDRVKMDACCATGYSIIRRANVYGTEI